MAEWFGEWKIASALDAVQEFGDRDEFGEVAGRGVEYVSELGADPGCDAGREETMAAS
ncbi:hypothetical protein [Streptomyces sp. NPDC021212]|uniref:hypothetical protein n=1 Tax=Streptomyces sp. NPDC021212 TaxID=3365118 RepID=UPI0037B7F8D4